MSDDRPVVVLGASGFLGAAVTAALARSRVPVRAVGRRPLAPVRWVERVHADLRDPDDVADAVRGARAVINLAAAIGGDGSWRIDGQTAADPVNRDLTGRLVRLLADGSEPTVLVLASTTSLARQGAGMIDGTEPDAPSGHYARQKDDAERCLRHATRHCGLAGVTVRLPTVFGVSPGPAGTGRGVVSTMARRAVEGRPLTLWNDGATRRDLLHLDDAADAVVAALDHAPALAGRHWVVGTGVGTSLRDLFDVVADEAARRTARPRVPVTRGTPPDRSLPADHLDHVVDATAFTERTGWRPRAVLDDAIRRTVAAVVAGAAASVGPR